MKRKSKIPTDIKVKSVERYLAGKVGRSQAARESGINERTFDLWVAKYKAEGSNGLCPQEKNKKYPVRLKEDAVEDYLKGTGSLVAICEKYGISSKETLRNWM